MGTSGFESLIDSVEDAKDEIREEATQTAASGLRDVRQQARRNLEKNGTNASGDLSDSLVVHEDWRDGFATLTTTSSYGLFVEEGTGRYGPHDAPSLSPKLVRRIDEWIDEKPVIPQTVSRYELPYAIASTIAEEGTPSQPFFKPAWYAHRGQIIREMRSAVRDAMRKSF